MAQHFFNGGTNFERPLNEAVSILEDSAFHKGDIVFLTDGEAEVSLEFLERFRRVKREKAFNVISVVIGYADEAVRVFSDQVMKVQRVSSSDDTPVTFVVESLN